MNKKKMATCFGPLQAGAAGRPPRDRRLSSTYRSFRQPDEEQPRNRRLKTRSVNRTDDGYASDTPYCKPFLSTFKSDDHDFQIKLLGTLREKSKSTQSLTERKPSPLLTPVVVSVPKLEKRTVTFSVPKPPSAKIVPSELPHTTFEMLKKQANTLHPKLLFSTTRYPNLTLTIIRSNLSYCSSLTRPKRVEPIVKLFRSQSDSDLSKDVPEIGPVVPNAGLNKCLRVLSGSWRNLLHREFRINLFFLSKTFPSLRFLVNMEMRGGLLN